MKKLFRRIVAGILGWQVKRLRARHDILVVAVAGSIGKTSTKFAIAEVLRQKYRVGFQAGNYNDLVTVPLVFFDQPLTSLFNPVSWLKIFIKNELKIRRNYPYDVVVLELGTDGPGFMAEFQRYLTVDIGVLTAIAPEHMEYFGSLDAVAAEELKLADYSKQLVINTDLCAPEYTKTLDKPFVAYGFNELAADYRVTQKDFKPDGCHFTIKHGSKVLVQLRHDIASEVQLYSIAAATAVAHQLDLKSEQITEGIKNIQPVSGRMQRLRGINNSVIIDDTYNASPEAVKAALDALYRLESPQKIAILGNMNELGDFSQAAHEEIGSYCDPGQLDLVLTLGPDANRYLAPAADSKGCQVEKFDSPYDLAEHLKPLIKPGAVILAKGSQNGVFAEEAVKQLLADPADASKLVRQSPHWQKVKQAAFQRP